MPTRKDERTEDRDRTAERRAPEEPTPRRAAAEEDDRPVVQMGEDPGTIDPEAD